MGWIDGPELLISLRQVCTTGGIGDHWSPGVGPVDLFGDPGMPDPVFDGADGARAVVRRMSRAGADWIKVTATGSILQGARAQHSQVTPEEMAALGFLRAGAGPATAQVAAFIDQHRDRFGGVEPERGQMRALVGHAARHP